MSDEKWRAKGVDFDLAIAKARAHLSLTEVPRGDRSLHAAVATLFLPLAV